eukprot:TRINITY_DN27232_c0_g1_i1.p1 TRINITY_DN27232_c0_g1~~TRINITY_DN27232_c0_g1_i1.p1  ORF type:complete len:412 (+),score=89.71 TRINITY_DN27232_c0_g1_i1:100-1335(+)
MARDTEQMATLSTTDPETGGGAPQRIDVHVNVKQPKDTSAQSRAQIYYGILVFLCTILCLIFYESSKVQEKMLDKISGFDECDDEEEENTCLGRTAVYKVCFCLFIFFCVLLVAQLPQMCSESGRWAGGMVIHSGLWWLKVLVLIGFIVAMLWVPNQMFVNFAQFMRVASLLFILVQALVLIECAYKWNDLWVERGEEKKLWSIGVLVCGFLFIAGSIVMIVFCYIWYTRESGCHLNKFLISSVLVLIILFSIAGITPLTDQGGILPSGVVAVYSVYFLWSALYNQSDSCNEILGDGTTEKWQLAVGLIILSTSVSFAGVSAGTGGGAFSLDRKTDDENGVNPMYFHAMMALASLYMGMVVTGWIVEGDSNSKDNANDTALWVKMVSVWLTILLYCWSLVAPRILKGREFS